MPVFAIWTRPVIASASSRSDSRPASLMFGTIRPRSVAAAMPRLTYSLTTISFVDADQVELTIGCRAIAIIAALATSSSGETRTSRHSGMALSRSSAFIVRVTSTVRNSVTCGAVNALATMFSAVSLRTPLIGMRCSRSGPKRRGRRAATPLAWAGPRRRRAACTSSRVIEPCGPVPDEREQVDAEVLGQLADRRLGQRDTGAGRCRRRCGRDRSRGRCRRWRRRRRGRGHAGPALRPRRPCADAAWPPRSSGRNRPEPRYAHRAPAHRSDPARPRPRPARSRPRPATPPTAPATGRPRSARRSGRCRWR